MRTMRYAPVTRRGLLVGAGAMAAAGPWLAGCSDDEPAGPTGPADEVTYMTTFGITPNEIYGHVARQLGYFEQENIHISRIEAGRGGDYNHGQLNTGNVDFVGVDSSGAFTRYVNGLDIPDNGDTSFQIIGMVHQEWPMGLLAFADNVPTPRDLNGKTIGLAAGTIVERMWPTYAANTPGVDADTIEVAPTDPGTQVGQLIGGQLDAIGLFTISAAGIAAAAGREVVAHAWNRAMPDLFGNAIITRKELIAENPTLPGRFAKALMRGLRYTLENPQAAFEILVEAVPEEEKNQQDEDAAVEQITRMADYCTSGLQPGQPLGYIDVHRLTEAIGALESLGEFDPGPDSSGAVHPPDGEGDEGVVNFLYVPGAEQNQS